MTPPTAPERCPTCDKPKGDQARADAHPLAKQWSAWIAMVPGQQRPLRWRDVADAQAADQPGMCIEGQCQPVDWRARAIAAEAELAGASAAICDVSDTIRRALDGDEGGMRAPYHGPLAVVLRYPSIAADLRRLDEVLTIGSPRAAAMRDAAAQWAKVAPLIERLRAECGAAPFRGRVPSLIECAAAILAATEATP